MLGTVQSKSYDHAVVAPGSESLYNIIVDHCNTGAHTSNLRKLGARGPYGVTWKPGLPCGLGSLGRKACLSR